MAVLWILIALVALVLGSTQAIQGARQLATALGLSPLVVGLTITAVGTSLPEIATNLAVGFSAFGGEADPSGLAVGNIIGSNLSQITLLLGITALVSTLKLSHSAIRLHGGMALVALLLMGLTALDGVVGRLEALALVLVYLGYLAYLLYRARTEDVPGPDEDEIEPEVVVLKWAVLRTVVALVVVLGSAKVVVDQGVVLAQAAGVSDTLIGHGVGLATGLPELVLALSALRAGEQDMGIGNLLGSNITDPLLSFGLGALVHPVTVLPGTLTFDGVFWLVSTVIALLLLWEQRDLTRPEGASLVLLYGLFLWLRIVVVG
jgi:cation:H+ antiporter